MDPLTGNSTSKQCACRVGGGLPSSRTRFVFSVCRLVSRRCHAISSILGCPARPSQNRAALFTRTASHIAFHAQS